MGRAEDFSAKDGDEWFRRNQPKLGAYPETDWPLILVERNGLRPKVVAEVGCANGWRLPELERCYGSSCYGLDISPLAIADGKIHYPGLRLTCATALSVASVCPPVDLVIAYFVFHWIEREEVLRTATAIDQALVNGGYLLLGDFAPFRPVNVPYHHRPPLLTYKAPYQEVFLATGVYREIDSVIFDHDSGEVEEKSPKPPGGLPYSIFDEKPMPISSERRAGCWLLRKGAA